MQQLRPGEIVRLVRRSTSKTQLVFAADIGCSEKHLCMVENSLRPVSVRIAKKIVRMDHDYSLSDLI